MNSLLYYYNNVQKMAAYRQAKRMQRGVISGFRQPIVDVSSTKFTMPPINIGTSDFSFEYFGNSSNVLSQATAIYFIYNGDPHIVFSGINGGNGILAFAIAEKTTVLNWEAGSIDELFHIVLSREGKSISLYVNGQKLSGFETSEVIDFGDISFMFSNASNLGLIRMWNYALSADEIATLDNNGDPMGYVVPKAMRNSLLAEYLPQNLMESRKGPEVEPTAEIFEFNLETAQYLTIFQINNNLFYSVYRIDYTVDEWEFDPTPSQFVGFGGKPGVTLGGNIKFNTLEDAKIGEQQTFYAYLTKGAFRGVDLYAGSSQESSTTRRLKVTIKGITPMSVPISWLDSAKQLPLSDEYMEPLFQSIGGYDMTANGAPEILYNE